MPAHVTILDAGSGNLRSVAKALAHVGARPTVTGDPDAVARADRLVVPGQGAFGAFARAIEARGLDQALRAHLASGRPFLGICLGLQALYDDSEEQGPVPGLGVLRGHVVRLRPADPALCVPHMGWNDVRLSDTGARDPILAGIPDGAHFYFVHSYHAVPDDPGTVAVTCDYGGPLVAAVRVDNMFACQFHPEKSQAAGLRLLANFVAPRAGAKRAKRPGRMSDNGGAA